MCLGVLMVQLDTSIVSLGLRAIQAGVGGSIATLQWVTDGYNLAYAGFILTGGTLGDLFGRRKLFLTGAGLFTAASVGCGLAPNAGALIAARAVAGLGAALALPGSLAILAVAYPDDRQRAQAVGIWASVNALAIALGPTIGGFLVDAYGWRSIFLAIVPVGLAAVVLSWRAVPESADPAGRQLDAPGQLLAATALALLALAAIEGHTLGWTTWPILASLVGALASLIVFVIVEGRTRGALVPLDVFRQPAFTASVVVAALMTFGMYGLLFLVPQFLQTALGHSAIGAGLELAPLGLCFAMVSPVAGRLAAWSGPRRPIAGGMLLTGLGLLSFNLVSAGSSYGLLLAALLALGLALGIETGPLMAVAVGSIPAARAGMASGLVNCGRMIGASLGVAILGSVFDAITGGRTDAEAFSSGLHAAVSVGGLSACLGGLLAWRLIDDRCWSYQRGG
jgi:MFS transporter, DHA2 family, methylenomycin A resistance protein